MERLNPCPFCGYNAIYETRREDYMTGERPQIFCNGCKVIVEVENNSPYFSDDETIQYLRDKLVKIWNRRERENIFREVY